jgi:phosphotransferase system enzyme I (PtsI)
MEIKRGIAVSPGVAIGPALVLDAEGAHVPRRRIEPFRREAEVSRLRQGLAAAAAEARANQDTVSAKLGSQYSAIFGAHALMIEDPILLTEVEALIRNQGFSAEYAFSHVMGQRAEALQSLHGSHFATRVADLRDVEKAVLRQLLGRQRQQLRRLEHSVILVARELSPSQTASLDPRFVHGLAIEAGGRASHTAILAGVLHIPAVVGLGRLLADVAGDDPVIVDGNRGLLIVEPDEKTLAQYRNELETLRSFEQSLESLRDLPAETRDGVRVTLMGNIEFPQEADQCRQRGADGVGLYRTEFLYLDRESHPSEQEHFEAYLSVVRALAPRPVVVRTLDLGADKFPGAPGLAAERNPFLGLRSIRLSLRNLPLFKTQLRAILRASAYGDVRILFPMVSTLAELRQCKEVLNQAKGELEKEGVAFNPRLAVGTMIEVPSAAILADRLAHEVDFFSIGTNDLIQYTLAADRTNEALAGLYSPGDPAVLRLIERVIQTGQQHGVSVNVCGEMSGEPMYALLLLGMGLRQLSLKPHSIPEIKKVLRSVTVAEVETIAREVLRMETAHEVNTYLREQAHRVLPGMPEVRGS